MNPFTTLKALWSAWWAAHGTKILGFWMAAITTVSLIDQKTLNLIGTTLGPGWINAVLILSGLATAYRGFTNTKASNGPH